MLDTLCESIRCPLPPARPRARASNTRVAANCFSSLTFCDGFHSPPGYGIIAAPGPGGPTQLIVKTTNLFGIPNCDSVRGARRWLDERGIAYGFHDFRKEGLEASRLAAWVEQAGWETLLNRKGTTWRRLPAAQREGLDARRAQALMLAQPTLIKRPVLETGKHLEVGFDADRYATLFKG